MMVLGLALAAVMLAAAISMFRSAARDAGCDTEDDADPQRLSLGLVLLVGLGVGGLTGLVGIGGGFLIVPALVVLAKVPMKQSVGTLLLVIAMNCASGFLGYLGQVSIPWGFAAAATL